MHPCVFNMLYNSPDNNFASIRYCINLDFLCIEYELTYCYWIFWANLGSSFQVFLKLCGSPCYFHGSTTQYERRSYYNRVANFLSEVENVVKICEIIPSRLFNAQRIKELAKFFPVFSSFNTFIRSS